MTKMIKPSQVVKLLANNEIDKMAKTMDDDMLHLLEEIS